MAKIKRCEKILATKRDVGYHETMKARGLSQGYRLAFFMIEKEKTMRRKKMGIVELFFIAVGLAMDAFAVSVCKGLSAGKAKPKYILCVGCYFGGFQALMPAVGYFVGRYFQGMIESVDHWIAFVLLLVIGGNMIRESRSQEECVGAKFDVREMTALAVATSIDALAVGVTFAFLNVDIVSAVLFIGCVTFVLSAVGLKIGTVFGTKYKSKAECFGGIVLILIGFKILLEHLSII